MRRFFFLLIILCLFFFGCYNKKNIKNLNGEWDYKIGFKKEWLYEPESIEWLKIKIPINLYRVKGFKKYEGPVTFKKDITEIIKNLKLKNNSISFRSGLISDVAEFYLNNNKIGQLGSIYPYKSGFERELIGILQSESFSDKIILYIVVYNFNNFQTYGLLGPNIIIGGTENVFYNFYSDFCINLIITIIYLVVGLYLMFIGLRVNKEFYNFYFSVFCIALSVFTISNLVGKEVIFGSNVFLRVKLDNLSLPILSSAFALFISQFFYAKYHKIPIILLVFNLLVFVINAFVPIYFLKYTFIFCSIFIVFINIPYSFFHIFKQLLKKNPDAIIISIGTFLLAIGVTHDIFSSLGIIEYFIISSYSFLTFIICIFFVLTNRFLRAHNQIEILNISLEKKVEERTFEVKKLNDDLKKSNEELQEKNRQLMHIAERDSLTGLLNHKSFHTRLNEVFNESIRFKFPFCIIMMDIDNFKNLNDEYGHQFGDDVIIKISEILTDSMRNYDIKIRYLFDEENKKFIDKISGRYGGDEFCLILPYCKYEDAEMVVNRILTSIRKIRFENLSDIQITTSIGVAVYDPLHKCNDEKKIIKLADDALYYAKKKGRDQAAILKYNDK